MKQRNGIKIEGHRGSWYVINDSYHNGKKVYLLEHETYGEDAAALIVDGNCKIIMADVWNGFDDLP